MSNSDVRADVAAAFDQLGRLTLGERDMAALLQSVTDLAQTVLPGAPETSVTLLVDDEPRTVVHTGPVALACDEVQYAVGDGPCLTAARSGVAVEIPDVDRDDRWTAFAACAREHGITGSLSVPLPSGQQVVGSLNVYARETGAFGGPSRALAARFAPYAALAIATLGAYRGARDMAGHLEQALQSRAVIDQAKGILMERYKLTADQAFQMLATASMATNTKLRDVATWLVETGELPRAQH